MKLRMGFSAVSICILSLSALGQTLQANVGITTSSASLCQDIENGTTALTASTSCGWNDGSGDFASGKGTAAAAYGILQSFATLKQTITNSSAETDTGTQTGSEFIDSFTFPQLTTNAFLQATLSVSGSESLSAAGFVGISADVFLNGSSNCELFATGTCMTSLPVSPGDQVSVQGSLGTEASAGPTSGSSTLNFTGKKVFGAHFGFVLLDSDGHKLYVPIVAASGTNYPAK